MKNKEEFWFEGPFAGLRASTHFDTVTVDGVKYNRQIHLVDDGFREVITDGNGNTVKISTLDTVELDGVMYNRQIHLVDDGFREVIADGDGNPNSTELLPEHRRQWWPEDTSTSSACSPAHKPKTCPNASHELSPITDEEIDADFGRKGDSVCRKCGKVFRKA